MARTPTPSSRTRAAALRGSRSARPIMALLHLLGRRWALRVLWELRDGRQTFRGLQEACDNISPAVLSGRLKELREACLVDAVDGEGYGLSSLGLELLDRFLPIVGWADRWAKTAAKRSGA